MTSRNIARLLYGPAGQISQTRMGFSHTFGIGISDDEQRQICLPRHLEADCARAMRAARSESEIPPLYEAADLDRGNRAALADWLFCHTLLNAGRVDED